MAATRNKNTRGNYCLDQRQNIQIADWQTYHYGANGYAYDTKLAGVGLNPGRLPWYALSRNAVDIESFLWGVNATNLVNPAPPLTPEPICLGTANLYKMPDVYLPVPLVVPKGQRPFPV